MPAWVIALALAVLSLIPAIGSLYRAIVTRTFNQKQYGEGSIHGGSYLLRIPIFIGFYILSAISLASIFVESPTWGVGMWVTVVLGVPLYIGTSLAAGWFVERKEKAIPLVKEARAARFAVIATGALLCVVFMIASIIQPAPDYGCAADAFMAAPKPFDGSPSALMRDVGDLAALVGGLQSYALVKLSESSWHVYLLLQVFLNAAAMLGVAGMLSVCLIEPRELKRVFLVLENDENGDNRPFVRSFCVAFVVLPLILVAGIVSADMKVREATQPEGYALVKKVIHDHVSLVVYEFDGKYYNEKVVDELLANAKGASEALSLEMEEALVPLINASFDARVANVDSYLDWYYGLFTDWEMLLNVVTGSAEDFAKEQLENKIEQGVDDSELNETFERYVQQAKSLQQDTLNKLKEYELTEDYPDWLVTEKRNLDIAFEQSLEPSERFLEASERAGISLATGAISGVIAKKVVGKIAAKAAFKAIASRVGGLAAASAASSAGGPVTFAIAVVASFGADIAMVKADELANRESYKQELVSAIEEQREEMLSLVRGVAAVE